MNSLEPIIAIFTSAQDIDTLVHLSESTLSSEELAKASLYISRVDRVASLATHTLKRLMLTYLDCQILSREEQIKPLKPFEWKFGHTIYGKPIIHPDCDRDYSFSISHTRSGVACAVTANQETSIGIDIEKTFTNPFAGSVEQHVLTPEETIDSFGLSQEAKAQHHSVLWTLKESWLKSVGLGLSMPMNRVGFIGNEIKLVNTHAPDWVGECTEIYRASWSKDYVSSCVGTTVRRVNREYTKREGLDQYPSPRSRLLLVTTQVTTIGMDELLKRTGFHY